MSFEVGEGYGRNSPQTRGQREAGGKCPPRSVRQQSRAPRRMLLCSVLGDGGEESATSAQGWMWQTDAEQPWAPPSHGVFAGPQEKRQTPGNGGGETMPKLVSGCPTHGRRPSPKNLPQLTPHPQAVRAAQILSLLHFPCISSRADAMLACLLCQHLSHPQDIS